MWDSWGLVKDRGNPRRDVGGYLESRFHRILGRRQSRKPESPVLKEVYITYSAPRWTCAIWRSLSVYDKKTLTERSHRSHHNTDKSPVPQYGSPQR